LNCRRYRISTSFQQECQRTEKTIPKLSHVYYWKILD